MLKDLGGKVALVTGAGSGIGRAVAEALAAAGMRLVVCDINTGSLAEISASLTAAGVSHIAAPLDIRDRAAWADVALRAERELGPVQILCNMAGVTVAPTHALDLSGEAWDWIVATNLTGAFNGVSAIAGRLRALGLPGHIVNTASVQGLYAVADFAAYNAAKFGIVGLSETLLMDLAPQNIGVSVLCPGQVRSNMFANSQKIAPHLVNPPSGTRPREGFSHPRTAAQVADQVVAAIRQGQFYIISHNEFRGIFEARWRALDASIDPVADPEAVANVHRVESAALAAYAEIGGGGSGD